MTAHIPYIRMDNSLDEDILILNKTTVDILFAQENPTDIYTLYGFYYKTAKWQKTNNIRATDSYIAKSLAWGKERVTRAKKRLKELGLITIIQKRNSGKIDSWYVQVGYIVSKEKTEKVAQLLEEELAQVHHNPREQEVVHHNPREQEVVNRTHMLKEYNINMLKEYNNSNTNTNNARMCDSYIAKQKEKTKSETKSEINWNLIKPELQDTFKPLIQEFIQYRKELKNPMTNLAINIFITKLLKLSNEDINLARELVNISIENGWKSVFPLKPNLYPPQSKDSVMSNSSALRTVDTRPAESALDRFKAMKFGEEWKEWHGGMCTYNDINAVFESNGIQLVVDEKFLTKFQEFFDCYNKLNKSIDIAGYVVPEDHFKKPEKFRDRLIAPTTFTSYSFDSWIALYVEYLKKKYPTIDKMFAGHFDINGTSFDAFVTSDWFTDQKIRTNDIGAKRHRYIGLAESVLKKQNSS